MVKPPPTAFQNKIKPIFLYKWEFVAKSGKLCIINHRGTLL